MVNRIELGSEYNLSLNELNIKQNNLFSYMQQYETAWFDYGRSAIRCISNLSKKRVLLPEFVCESVISCFSVEQVCFYKVNERLEIDVEDLLDKIDDSVGVVYIVHYFGYLQKEEVLKVIREYTDKYSVIMVEDLTQSLFSEYNLIGDYGIASVRKWMPVPQGGVLFKRYGTNHLKLCEPMVKSRDNSRAYGMMLKDLFLSGEYDTNKKYRQVFAECEEKVDELKDIKQMSDFARFIASCVDVENLITRRKENTARLHEELNRSGITCIREFLPKECPLVYPIRIAKRDDFRSHLVEHRVYCAVHWPFDGVYMEQRGNAVKNAETLLSLPIDQRYGEKEIDYLIEVIKKYGGDLSF